MTRRRFWCWWVPTSTGYSLVPVSQLGDVTVRPVKLCEEPGCPLEPVPHYSVPCGLPVARQTSTYGELPPSATTSLGRHAIVCWLSLSSPTWTSAVRCTAFCTACLSGTAAAKGAKTGPRALSSWPHQRATLFDPTPTACHTGRDGAALATRTSPCVFQGAGVCLYKAMNNLAPAYPSDLLTPYTRHPHLKQQHDELQLATPVAWL